MHAMPTHHRGAGCLIDRDIDLHVKNEEGINKGINNDNESASGLDTIIELEGPGGATKSVSHISATTFPSTNTTAPFGEVICQYTDTLCTTQMQTNLNNSSLQDITVFNEYDSTKLEDWLTDIETAADLTIESQTELAKAKLRELTHTLVPEAINSNKSWEEIKDLLRLKLCNANTHTYTSCFLDIQKWEKESLAVYINKFKTEANRCNVKNDAATIRIFLNRLKMPIA